METTQFANGNEGGTPALSPAAQPKPPAYRWVVLFVVWIAFLLSYVDRVAWSTVAAPVGHSLGISIALLGAFVTAFYVGYVLANALGGILTDTIGGRRTLVWALIPLGISTFCFSFTHNLTTGFAIQLVMGIAAGADYSAGVKIITSWFGKDRGRALGLYATATSLAVVIANASVPTLAKHFSWQIAFRSLGSMTLVWAFVCLALLRDSPFKTPSTRISRVEIGALVRNRNLILLSFAGCGALWATVGFGAWGNALMTKQYGISPVTAGSISALFGVGAVIAKPLLGWLTDLMQGATKRVSIACLVGFSFMLLVFGQCSTVTQFYLVAPFLGAVAFGYTPVLIAQVTEASGLKFAGAAAGLTNAIWQSGSALSPIVVGQVYASTHSFFLALVTLAAGPLCGSVLLLGVTRKSRIAPNSVDACSGKEAGVVASS
ncbi:MFS transporter [Burkholderia cepacia]|uniref:MFS transporter n=1 Tax=Burkholderia cepacia TaxID=292 RepID=UPI001CF17670|nr:MFS transporter [Burkholderia cepacia]MCA8030985.1 MFS transporter [Burkholderia cepacia]